MNQTKKLLVAVGVVSSIAVAAGGAGLARAATTTIDGQNGQSNLVDKIATKFNLNKDEVKAVFEEGRAAHEKEMEAKMEERLNTAVSEGKITAEQKQKIVDKLAEMKANRESEMEGMKDKTEEERKSAMDAKRAELEKWASDNGISLEYLRVVRRLGPGGPGGPGPRGS